MECWFLFLTLSCKKGPDGGDWFRGRFSNWIIQLCFIVSKTIVSKWHKRSPTVRGTELRLGFWLPIFMSNLKFNCKERRSGGWILLTHLGFKGTSFILLMRSRGLLLVVLSAFVEIWRWRIRWIILPSTSEGSCKNSSLERLQETQWASCWSCFFHFLQSSVHFRAKKSIPFKQKILNLWPC